MLIYNIIYLWSLFNFLFFYLYKNKKIEKISNIFIIIFLFIISGFRYYTGVDYEAYVEIFNLVPMLKFPIDFSLYKGIHGEKGYLIFNSLIKTLGLNYEIVFCLISFFTLIILYKSLKKSPYLSFGVYIYVSNFFLREVMGQIRNGLATILCLYSLQYIEKNKKIYYLLVTIAFYIQGVAIIFFFLPLISKILENIKCKILVFFSVSFLGLVISRNLLLKIAFIISENYGNKLLYSKEISFSLYQVYVILLTMVILIFFKKISLKKNKKELRKYINIFYLGGLFYFIFFNFGILAARFNELFYKGNIILFPLILKEINNRKIKIIFIIFILIIHTYFYYGILLTRKAIFIPYKNIFMN